MPYSVFLPDEAATLALGANAAGLLNAPATVYLEGGLGAGKTTFARGLLHALGYVGAVKSRSSASVILTYTASPHPKNGRTQGWTKCFQAACA